jgi:hypothetical protein
MKSGAVESPMWLKNAGRVESTPGLATVIRAANHSGKKSLLSWQEKRFHPKDSSNTGFIASGKYEM